MTDKTEDNQNHKVQSNQNIQTNPMPEANLHNVSNFSLKSTHEAQTNSIVKNDQSGQTKLLTKSKTVSSSSFAKTSTYRLTSSSVREISSTEFGETNKDEPKIAVVTSPAIRRKRKMLARKRWQRWRKRRMLENRIRLGTQGSDNSSTSSSGRHDDQRWLPSEPTILEEVDPSQGSGSFEENSLDQ